MALLGLSACTADPTIDGTPIDQGESVVSFGATFRPLLEASLGKTRSNIPGDAIENINDIFVVWYLEDGSLAGSHYFTREQLNLDSSASDSKPDDPKQHATFDCRVPFGRYRIYAVANAGDLTENEALRTEKNFKALPLKWNADDVTKNAQMSGYFSEDPKTAYAKGPAPLVTISQPNVSLHAWLRRAASKVTVAFDAKNLNENIYIYLKSAQIRDIPLQCTLVDENKPADTEALLPKGNTILFGSEETDFTKWPTLACGRGANTYGSHAADAPSLFFYENMQGTHENKHIHDNYESKDDVPYGTYVEVEAYYINKSAENPSRGTIFYRCMLGKNMTNDFNAERNTHYRLTLVFKNNANDPDWHIDYSYEPRPPEIMVPSPIYISYLSNQTVSIPVTVYYDENVAQVESVSAKIIRNDWGFEGHKYDYTHKEPQNGYLSLERINTNTLTDRFKQYTDSLGYKNWLEVTPEKYRIDIPIYTRPMTLGSSFSGNNYFVGRRRYAIVELTANLVGGGSVKQKVEIIQSRRLVNPKGVWRKGNSMKPFRITLKNSDSAPTIATTFDTFPSDGPWTATIVQGKDWVQIKDAESQNWGTEDVTGGTGSIIEFDYRPASTYPSGCRFGVIEIKFHNNTCTHMVLVSQGIGTVELEGRKWHMTNLKYGGVDEENPLLEGSMFKFGNSTDAFLASNNMEPGYGFDYSCADKMFEVYDAQGGIVRKQFNTVPANIAGFVDNAVTNGGKCRVAETEDWETLTTDRYTRYYGILYGEECEATLSSNSETNTYYEEGQVRGIRGCFVCEQSTGKHLFLPIGSTGYGRRKYKDDVQRFTHPIGYGVLKYADRTEEMPKATAENVPNYYSLWNEPGALYWYGKPVPHAQFYYTCNEINYFSFGFGRFTSNILYENNTRSDAAFVRRIDN